MNVQCGTNTTAKTRQKIPLKHLFPDRFTEPTEKALYLHSNLFTRYYLEFSFQGMVFTMVFCISRRHLESTHHVVLTVFNYFLLSDIQMTDSIISGQVTHLFSSRSLSVWMCLMYHCYFNSRGRGIVYLVYIGLLANSEEVWRQTGHHNVACFKM